MSFRLTYATMYDPPEAMHERFEAALARVSATLGAQHGLFIDGRDVEAEHSAEVAPLEEPQFYQFDIPVPKVAELWRRGSVISSWLLDLTAAALQQNPQLDGLAGRVSDSGEGRWTVKAAVDVGVPAPVLSSALFERFASRDEDHFANQILSAMRQQFGGHQELPAGDVLEAGGRKSEVG